MKIQVHKAMELHGMVPPDTEILIQGEGREPWMNTQEATRLYHEDAQTLFYALYNSLPGATYAELMRLMKEKQNANAVPNFR